MRPRHLSFALAAALAGCGLFRVNPTTRVGAEAIAAAPRPAPVDSTFHGCGPAGALPDHELNLLKNRVDAGAYLDVPWRTVAQLPWPRKTGYRFRDLWTRDERHAVARYEGAAVRVEGYLAGYRLEIPEPPNCYSRAEHRRDFHLWLGERANGSKKRSIVVELTPRVRARHPAWDEARLAWLVHNQSPLRVSGWLMLDQMHPELVGRNRVTLWEIHPVLALEWKRDDGRWLPVDSLPLEAEADDAAPGR